MRLRRMKGLWGMIYGEGGKLEREDERWLKVDWRK